MSLTHNLYKLGVRANKIAEILEEMDGDITLYEDEITELLSSDAEEAGIVLNDIGNLVRTIEGIQNAQKAEARRLMDAARKNQSRIDTIKKCIVNYMSNTDESKVVAGPHTFSKRKAGGKQTMELSQKFIEAPDQLPRHFQKVEIKPNNDEIRKHAQQEGNVLNDGTIIYLDPNGIEIARILPRKEIVTIK